MSSGLQLEGGVNNIKVPNKACLEIIENLRGMPGFEAVVLDDDMG